MGSRNLHGKKRLANESEAHKGHPSFSHCLLLLLVFFIPRQLEKCAKLGKSYLAALDDGWPAIGRRKTGLTKTGFKRTGLVRFFCAFYSWCKNVHRLVFKGGGGSFRMCRIPPLNKNKVSTWFCGLNKSLLQTAQNRAKFGVTWKMT